MSQIYETSQIMIPKCTMLEDYSTENDILALIYMHIHELELVQFIHGHDELYRK